MIDDRCENSTCAEREEEEFHLLTLGEQLDEVKLEGDDVDAVLRGQSFSCTHTANRVSKTRTLCCSSCYFLFLRSTLK